MLFLFSNCRYKFTISTQNTHTYIQERKSIIDRKTTEQAVQHVHHSTQNTRTDIQVRMKFIFHCLRSFKKEIIEVLRLNKGRVLGLGDTILFQKLFQNLQMQILFECELWFEGSNNFSPLLLKYLDKIICKTFLFVFSRLLVRFVDKLVTDLVIMWSEWYLWSSSTPMLKTMNWGNLTDFLYLINFLFSIIDCDFNFFFSF